MSFSLHLSAVLWTLSVTTAHWCYQAQYSCNQTCRAPGDWFTIFPKCGGNRQSPINIVTNKVQHDPNLTALSFLGYHDAHNITVENVGHSAHFSLPPSLRIRGGNLMDTYKAVQFHLHWGYDASPGSEHTLDGERLPMELHVVHIKERYNSLEEAENDTSGIALLAFFFQESSEDNVHFSVLVDALGRVRNVGDSYTIRGLRFGEIIPGPHELHGYYRYAGSMTTPGCDQAVVWTIFQTTIPVSRRQLASVSRQLVFHSGKPMSEIFRPVQRLNGRTVYWSAASSVLPSRAAVWLCALGVLGRHWHTR
ncbi:carbonic anhydrase IV c [Megalops cyprinoides]|uniref:carbonic anhydrase IV c n=1 Tax=Megalops cyprinoides TaxID=118141 RepID=UPI001863BCB0|nr:carbonic anhydrase IV c [Megalops cyprinoides]